MSISRPTHPRDTLKTPPGEVESPSGTRDTAAQVPHAPGAASSRASAAHPSNETTHATSSPLELEDAVSLDSRVNEYDASPSDSLEADTNASVHLSQDLALNKTDAQRHDQSDRTDGAGAVCVDDAHDQSDDHESAQVSTVSPEHDVQAGSDLHDVQAHHNSEDGAVLKTSDKAVSSEEAQDGSCASSEVSGAERLNTSAQSDAEVPGASAHVTPDDLNEISSDATAIKREFSGSDEGRQNGDEADPSSEASPHTPLDEYDVQGDDAPVDTPISAAEEDVISNNDDPASTNDLIQAAQILRSNDPGSTAEFAPIPLTPEQLKERKNAAKAAKKAAKQPLNWYAISDVGLVRDHNEDSYLAHPPLFAVCDGMGGHAAGEVASSIAIDAICRHAPLTADDVALGAAIEAANTAVIEGASSGRGKEGMGCTATCCIIKDERIAIAHVGDSRCYILHNGIMTRMTEDHSLVEGLVKSGSISADEARDHRYRSIITRALGSEPDMYADHLSTTIERGDRILLCSDGLSSMVSDYMIERTLCQDADAQATCEALLQQALEAGGHDNITIVVIDVASDVQRKRATRKTLKAVAFWVLDVIIACAVLVAAAALYINQTYFLTTEDNHVTVYQGVPGQFMGMPLNHLQNETTIRTDDLPASIQQNLRETISVSSKEEADKLLEEYRKQSDEKKLKDAEKRERSKESQGGQHE